MFSHPYRVVGVYGFEKLAELIVRGKAELRTQTGLRREGRSAFHNKEGHLIWCPLFVGVYGFEPQTLCL